MDISDTATAREEQERARALLQRKPTGPEPCGQCHNCGETLSGALRFCDPECRDDWEARNR